MKNFICLAGLMLLMTCGLEVEFNNNSDIKFDWVKEGSKLYYDYYTSQDTIPDFRYLKIKDGFDEGTDSSGSYYLVFHILDRKLRVKRDGLYGLACESCKISLLGCLSNFEFLYVPSTPILDQELTVYGCERKPYYSNKVIETSVTVTVPMGTFNTYIILHSNGDRSYWSPDDGLIMYEKYNKSGGTLIGTLKLNRIEVPGKRRG